MSFWYFAPSVLLCMLEGIVQRCAAGTKLREVKSHGSSSGLYAVLFQTLKNKQLCRPLPCMRANLIDIDVGAARYAELRVEVKPLKYF